MGFDTSHHPVDVALIHERLLPYVRGEGQIDDLFEVALRIAKVRFRAKAWALGALASRHAGIVPMLHVWGRPFFITVDGPAAIGAAIDRYLDCSVEAVDGVAREMLAAIDPALADEVEPDVGRFPDDRTALDGMRFRIDLMRECWAKLADGGRVRLPDGDLCDPAVLLARELPLTLLEVASQLRPGWMDRGLWPGRVLSDAALSPSRWLAPPRALLGDLPTRQKLDWFLHETLTENYMVGGLAERDRVAALRTALEGQRATDDDSRALSIQKMIETLDECERRGLAFVEATEVYSAFSGVLN
jgi:hypothetical protein